MLRMFHWVALIAAVVLVVAVAGVLVSSQPTNGARQQQTTEKDQKEHTAEKDGKTLWDRWFPDTISLFTLFLVVFTAVLAFVGIVQLNFLNRAESIAADTAQAAKTSADAAKDSADIARNTLVASQRPWVSILSPSVEGQVTWEEKGGRATIGVTVKNVGKSPAFDIAIEAHQFVIGPDTIDIGAQVRKFCSEVRKRQIARADSGQKGEVLFPDESLLQNIGLLFARADVEGAAKRMKIPFFSPVVVVCVDYRSAITKQSHATGLAYMLLKAPPKAGAPPLMLTPDETIGVPAIGLARAPFGSVAD